MRPTFSLPLLLAVWLAPLVGAIDVDSSWEPFGADQGLSGSSVTSIVQDEIGFLWFATQSGLNRWDGYTMRVWQKEPFRSNSLSHNLIQTMTLDRGGVLWLGTYGGLDRFDTATETFHPFRHNADDPSSLSHDVVTRIYRDSRGQLWVGTLDGLNRLDESSGKFRVYRTGDTGPSGKTIRTLVEDASGGLWVGSSEGLDRYDPVSDRWVPFAGVFPGRALPAGAVMASLRLPGDPYLWLAIWGKGLVRLDPANGESHLFPLSDDRLFGLNRGEAGDLHVGTWGGGLVVFHLTDGTSVTLKHDPLRPDSLAHDVVYGSFQDRGGLVWVATNGGGVSRYNPRRRQFQLEPSGGKVLALQETSSGSLWAGVYNGGLIETAPDGTRRQWRHNPKDPSSLSNDIINGLTEDANHRLWIMTNEGVNILDPATGRLTRWAMTPGPGDSLPDEVVNSLAIDRQGTFWFGTYRSGLVRRSAPGTPGPIRVYAADPHVPGTLPDNLVYFVQEDREGRIWVGTNGGLALYRPGTDDFRVWRYDPSDPRTLPSNTVRCLLEDSQGRFWVATNGGGLSRLDPVTGVLENFGLKEGLSNLSVYSVLEDANRRLWIASANGLFSFDPNQGVFRRYGKADGLLVPEFSAGFLRARDGRLLFGGLTGILTLRPGSLVAQDPPPPVALTSIQVAGNPRLVTPKLSLGWQENVVTFSFAALDFRNPGKNLYAYRLDGFDRDWVQSGTRHEVTYTNLWPGVYRFRFRGANPSEAWSESDQSLELTVQAAPWADWYAWLLYSAIVLTMVYLFQRARVSRTLGQKVSELEVLRTQLEEANRKLDQLARLDGLTGIPNRRALDEWLAGEGARALRQRKSISLLMIDIDDFKRYNDFYGHLEGDTCLKVVAKTLSESLLRTTDFVARYGGEEFVVVLHDTDLEGARIVAERLKDSIDILAMPHQMASAVKHVSISVGVASQVPGADRTVEDLLHAADQALYRAKALGRHRVETS